MRALVTNMRRRERPVDAFVVAVGDLAGGAVVATTEPKDLVRLVARAVAVTIASIQPRL